ncbi:MAG: hypothetical protein AB1714_02810 [Acidobacteriota bacterium]
MKKLALRTVMMLALAGLGLVVAGFTNAPFGKKIKMVVSGKTSFKRMYGMPGWTPVTPPDAGGKPAAAPYFMGFFKGQYESGGYSYQGVFAGIFEASAIVFAKSPLVSGSSSTTIIDGGGGWLPVAAGRGSMGAFFHSQWKYSYASGLDGAATQPIEYYLREFDAQGNPVGPATKILSSPPPKTAGASQPPEPTRGPPMDYPYYYENNLTFAYGPTGAVYLGATESWSRYTAGDAGPVRYEGPYSSQFWQLYTTKYQGSSSQWKKQLWKSGPETDSVITGSQAFDRTNWAVGTVNTYDVAVREAVERGSYAPIIRNDLYSFLYTYGAASPQPQAPTGRKVVKIASTDQGNERSYQSGQVLLDENGEPANVIFYQFRDLTAQRHCTLEKYVARYFFQTMKNGNPSGSPVEITVPVWNHKIKPSANIETDEYDELISELLPVGENRYLGFLSRNLSVKPVSNAAQPSDPAAANSENQLNVVVFNLDKKTGSFVGSLILGMLEHDYLERTTLMSSGTDLLFYVERVNTTGDWDKWRREPCWASATVEDFVSD